MKILRKIECWWRKRHIYCWYAVANGPFGVCLICGKTITEEDEG